MRTSGRHGQIVETPEEGARQKARLSESFQVAMPA